MLIAIGGCTSSIVSTPLVQRTYPNGLVGEKKILITGFEKEGGKCLKAEMYDYMKGTNKFDLINPTEQMSEREFEEFVEREKIDLVISGEMEMYTIGSSIGPTSNNIYAIASCRMKVIDTSTDQTIWSKKDNTFVEEEVKRGNIKERLLATACKNLATKMLNDFLNSYVAGSLRQGD